MNILILSHVFRPSIGGMETHLDDLCNYLVQKRHKVYVITYEPLATKIKANQLEIAKNLWIRRIPWIRLGFFFNKPLQGSLFEFFYFAPALFVYSFIFMLHRQREIDIINAHGLISAFIASILLKVFKKKSVVSIHWIIGLGGRSILSRLFIKMALSSHQRVLTLSRTSKEELINIGLDRNKVNVFTYWVDQSNFKPLDKVECKRKIGYENEFIVLFVGRLLEVKGVKLLLNIARRLGSIRDMYFMFIGDGPLAAELKRASGYLKNVLYVGRVQNKDLNVYYNAADLVVVPSLHEEGFGRVILEALSCGTPIIASMRGGIPEALDKSVGILVEPTEDNFINAIKLLYADRRRLLEMASKCRQYALKRFSEGNVDIIEKELSRCSLNS
jgi:glycosyltransferase involved in cell wall biosynthesis